MEREAVLHWLEDVQTAGTLDSEEHDGGLPDPDNYHHGSSDFTTTTFLHSPTEQAKSHPQLPHSGAGQYPYSLVPSSSFQVPQDPSSLIVRKRIAFKHSKSNTMSDARPGGGSKLKGKSPSFDFSGRDNAGNQCRNPLSPLPAVNPDMVLPTISLVEGKQVIPRRKPLLKESTFLSDLKAKTPLPSQFLQSPCVGVPKRGKSAPASPDICKITNRESLSVISIASKSYSQGDVRQPATHTLHDSDSDTSGEHCASDGSCVAARGQLSDVASSSDVEMLCESDIVTSSKENDHMTSKLTDGVTRKTGEESKYSKIEERIVVKKTGALQSGRSLALESFDSHSNNLQRCDSATQQLPSNQHRVIKRGPSPSLPILPSEVAQLHAHDHTKIPSFLPKRNLMQRSSSVQHSLSPFATITSQDSSLGLESLAFHDHHLGRRGSHKMMKPSMVDKSRLQQMPALEFLAHVTDSAAQLTKEKCSVQEPRDFQGVTKEGN